MPRGVYDHSKAAAKATSEDQAADPDVEADVAPSEAGPVAPDEPNTPPVEPAPSDDPELCPVCFPEGWPDGVTSAGCIHGQWERAL